MGGKGVLETQRSLYFEMDEDNASQSWDPTRYDSEFISKSLPE